MNAIGKFFVFLNLFAAVGLLAWGTSLYVNRVDLLDGKTADGQTVEGHITKMKKEIADLSAAIATADGRYGTSAAELQQISDVRDYREYVLNQRLLKARGDQRGASGPAKFQVQLPDPNNPALTDVTREGPVVQFQGADLEGVATVQAKLDNVVKDIQLAGLGSKQLMPADEVRISSLAGQPELEQEIEGLGITELRKVLGLLSTQVEYIEDATFKQKVILANLAEETDFILDNRLNWFVQLQTLERRQKQLDQRLKSYAMPN
jgi:hypothetical protein